MRFVWINQTMPLWFVQPTCAYLVERGDFPPPPVKTQKLGGSVYVVVYTGAFLR